MNIGSSFLYLYTPCRSDTCCRNSALTGFPKAVPSNFAASDTGPAPSQDRFKFRVDYAVNGSEDEEKEATSMSVRKLTKKENESSKVRST
jgi:hypothetical protein